MPKITKLDILEAIAGPHQSLGVEYHRGDVIASLAWIPGDYVTSVPALLRGPNDTALSLTTFKAGTSRAEAKKRLGGYVDRLYDTLYNSDLLEEEKEAKEAELLKLLKELSFERREVTLASGEKSDFYLDCKQTALHRKGACLIGELMYKQILVIEHHTEKLVLGAGGMTMGADPLATAVSLFSSDVDGAWINAFIVRKDKKGHGTGAWVEGRKNLPDGSNVILLEDVITSGGSTLKAYERCLEENLNPIGVVAIVDRKAGGVEMLQSKGLVVKCLFTSDDFL